SNPPLYQAICVLTFRFIPPFPPQSRSLPAVLFSSLDGVKTGYIPLRAASTPHRDRLFTEHVAIMRGDARLDTFGRCQPAPRWRAQFLRRFVARGPHDAH